MRGDPDHERRAFLRALFGASLGASLASAGCDAKHPRPEIEGALLGQNVAAGHLLRGDLRGRIASASALDPERVDTLIVGGGPAGLSAAYGLRSHGPERPILLELEEELGGTSLAGKSDITPYPWGAHYLPVPARDNAPLCELLRDMSVVERERPDGTLQIAEPFLVRKPEERLFYRGFWYAGLFLEAGASPRDHAQLARFEAEIAAFAQMRDGQGRPGFVLPTSRASQDPFFMALDVLPATHWLAARGFNSPRLVWLLDYACRDDYGTRLADTSAWALIFYFAARTDRADNGGSELISWPEGNGALVRHLARRAAPRVRTGQVVLDVHQEGESVHVHAWDAKLDTPRHYLARRVVLAVPRFIAARLVRSLRERGDGAAGFQYAPWIVANLHLSERPGSRGVPLAWDNVLYDSPSLGYVCATHQRGSDYGPSVFTYYLPLSHIDAASERRALLGADHSSYRDAILADLSRAHPNLPEVTTRIDVFRWGHAMVRPGPGFISSVARREAHRPLGRVHFAHTDLSGLALFEEAFDHGLRAAAEVIAGSRA